MTSSHLSAVVEALYLYHTFVPPVQEWSRVEILSSGYAEGRYEQENHPGTEVQLLPALKVSNPIGGQVLSSVH
jgi:hypothetical protein